MFGLRMASIGAALVILTSAAIAEPLQRSGKARKTISAPIASSASNDSYHVPYVMGADGEKHPIMEIPGSVTVISRVRPSIPFGEGLRIGRTVGAQSSA